MSIRSDVMVLTVFELFKVSIEIAIKKKRLSLDIVRRKKVAGVAPRDTNRCHTWVPHKVSSSTRTVAGTSPYTTGTVQQRPGNRGHWNRAQRAERNKKRILDKSIQSPEQACRPFRWSKDGER